MTRLQKLFASLAGADPDVLAGDRCTSARGLYVGRGVLLAALASMSAAFMYGALVRHMEPKTAAAVAILWGVVFASVERLVLMGLMKKSGIPFRRRAIVAAVRVALAVGLGFIFARSAELSIFSGPIARHIAARDLAEQRAAREVADASLAVETGKIRAEKERLVRELTAADSVADEAYRIAELEGAGKRSPQAGKGPLYMENLARARRLEARASAMRSRTNTILSDLQRRDDSLAAIRDGMLGQTAAAQDADIADALEAMYEMERDRPAIRAATWLFTIFFITLDILLCMLKLTDAEADAYETSVDTARRTALVELEVDAALAAFTADQRRDRAKQLEQGITATVINTVAAAVRQYSTSTTMRRDTQAVFRAASTLLRRAARYASRSASPPPLRLVDDAVSEVANAVKDEAVLRMKVTAFLASARARLATFMRNHLRTGRAQQKGTPKTAA